MERAALSGVVTNEKVAPGEGWAVSPEFSLRRLFCWVESFIVDYRKAQPDRE